MYFFLTSLEYDYNLINLLILYNIVDNIFKEKKGINMDLLTVLGLIIGNAALIIPLFLWNRAEARADMRHMDNKIEILREETNTLIKAIHEEIKDFHGRLCIIEERNKK